MSNAAEHWSHIVRDCVERDLAHVIVTVLGAQGSTPRDSGTKMVVTTDGFFGTIGGGVLEYSALEAAQDALRTGQSSQRIENYPLGEKLGQCCGGSTSLLFECFVPSMLPLYLFGAGHVGRALAPLLCSLPFHVHWVDSREAEFPSAPLQGAQLHHCNDPLDYVNAAPPGSYFVIMTHQHPLDFALLEAALRRDDSAYIGVIGSASKWRRFQLRLAHRGFSESLIDSVHCPIGLPDVPGKEPAEIAVSVAAQVIRHYQADREHETVNPGLRWKALRDQLRTTGVTVQASTSDSHE